MTKIPRKPVPCGMEGKCACDGESNIMIYIEIQEGKEAMARKKYQCEGYTYKFHTAVTLRCVDAWFGSSRLIVADSAFASVATAKALLSFGLHFIGIVKTATKGFPKDVCKHWESTNPQRGEMLYITANIPVNGRDHKLLAADWKTKMGKKIISTCSNSQPVDPQVVKRTKVVERNGLRDVEHYTKETPRSKLVKDLFDYFPSQMFMTTIDKEHLGQNDIGKLMFGTIDFTTSLGVIYTDCYFAYRMDYLRANNQSETNMLSYDEFLGQLAFEMIFNVLDSKSNATRLHKRKSNEDSLARDVEVSVNTKKKTRKTEKYKPVFLNASPSSARKHTRFT